MLRAARSAFLSALGALGLQDAALRMRWRQNRLLILGYHGVALATSTSGIPSSTCRRRFSGGVSS